jgi:hypothetical protein
VLRRPHGAWEQTLVQVISARAGELALSVPRLGAAFSRWFQTARVARWPIFGGTTIRNVGFTVSPNNLDAKNGKCEPDLMTQAAKKLLDEFDALPDPDRSELVAELVRRVALGPHDLPHDDDLVAAADRLFVEIDRREQSE